MTNLLLGIDIGTGGCKVNIIDTKGNWISSGSSEYETFHQYPQWSEQDPESWYTGFKIAFSKALQKKDIDPKKIISIGVDASTHNAVLLDENMAVLRNSIMWTDQRSTKEVQWLNENFGDEIFNIAYQKPSPTWTLPQLMWIRENERHIFDRVRYLMFTKDFVRFKLTGTWETDRIDAQGSLLIDMKNQKWSERICRIGSIPSDILPPLKEPNDISGKVTENAARDTNLSVGTPVIVGTSDTAIESYGVGIIEKGQCVVKMATAGTVNFFTEKPFPGPKSLTYAFVVPGLWYSCMGTNSAAASLRWFRDVFCQKEIEEAGRRGISEYVQIDQSAEQAAPGCDGLFFHPYLMGERSPYWDANLRASFTGVSAYHQKKHFGRAIMEGVAYSLKDCFCAAKEMGLNAEEIRFIGGGAKSRLWREILGNVLGKPVIKLKNDDSSFGIAMLAGVGVGAFSDLEDAVKKCVQVIDRIEPDPALTEAYGELFGIYKNIHDDLESTYANLSEVGARIKRRLPAKGKEK